MYIIWDELWGQAGDVEGCLCVSCLELRLGRRLVPDDFQELPLNDDAQGSTRRLTERKGTGRDSETRYMRGVDAVLDDGRDIDEVAAELNIDLGLLEIWVKNTRFNRQALAELEDE